MNRKTEKSILRLSHFIEKHKYDHLIKVDKDRIVIGVNDRSACGSIFYFAFMLLIPFALVIYFLLINYDLVTAGVVFLWLTYVAYYAYYMSRGDNILIVNLAQSRFEIENINPVFRWLFHKRFLDFSQVAKTTLSQKSADVRIKWLEVRAYDKDNKKIILSNFKDTFPSKSIASLVKETLDIILKEHRDTTPLIRSQFYEKQKSLVEVGGDEDRIKNKTI